jgi:hypothetical protein
MPFCVREDINSGRLRNIAQYLESRRGQDGLIRRADIDPVTDIPRDVSLLMLLEQTDAGRQRVRLMGTRAAEILGGDFTGRWIDDCGPKPAPAWLPGELEQIFASHAMFFGRIQTPFDYHPHSEVEWLGVHFVRAPSAHPTPEETNEVQELAIFAFDHRDQI